jgi:chromosome segregation ATPase
MELPGTSSKEVGKAWTKFIKKYKGKTKYERRANEYITEDATLKEMSDNTVDVIAKIEERGQDGSVISVWYNLGVSYLSSKDYSERYPAGEKLLKDFAKSVSTDMIEAELKEAEKLLKDKESDLAKLEKEEKQRTKDIEDYKNTIKKMEQNIVEAENDVKESKEGQGKAKVEI